jgi:hypothetical protein
LELSASPDRRERARRAVTLGGLLACLALGAPAPAGAAECAGDECQGPPPAPQEVTPGTAVAQGPPNPPVRFPKPHHRKPHKHPHEKKRPGGRG